MFEKSEQHERNLQILKDLTAGFDRGDTLLWSDVESALGLDRRDPVLKYAVKKWRVYLLSERKIETWGVLGVGVRLQTHSEAGTAIPRKRTKKALRQHRWSVRSIENTDFSALTERERMVAMAMKQHGMESIQKIQSVNSSTGRVIGEQKRLANTVLKEVASAG